MSRHVMKYKALTVYYNRKNGDEVQKFSEIDDYIVWKV